MKNTFKSLSENENIQKFTNPASMLTPGIAGTVVMTVANVLCLQFSLPAATTALALSLLASAVVFVRIDERWWKNAIYWFFNGLIIFTMAVGSNTLGIASDKKTNEPAPIEIVEPTNTVSFLFNENTNKPVFKPWFLAQNKYSIPLIF